MSYNPNIHHRRSIRLKGYDYSQAGLYFITICVQNRAYLFGEIPVGAPLVGAQNNGDIKNDGAQNNHDIPYETDAQNNHVIQNETDAGHSDGIGRPQGHAPTGATMILNDAGKMVEIEWFKLLERFPNIELHEYVVMPNHFHGILQIVDTTAAGKTVGDMMDAFKSITTVEYIRGVKTLDWPRFDKKMWQRDYWEHIIRDEPAYQRISKYIINNPAKWKGDKFYNQ